MLKISKWNVALWMAVTVVLGIGCSAAPSLTRLGVPKVMHRYETEPVGSADDAADDPAIWVHPENPALSLIIGTDKNKKQGGLHGYSLQGKQRFFVKDPSVNNVDIRQRVQWASQPMDLLAASRRVDSTIAFYAISSEGIRRVEGAPVKLEDPYGFCLGQDPQQNKIYAFNVGKNGVVEQFELSANDSGKVSGKRIRVWRMESQGEGCVADDATGTLWVGEESKGLWKMNFAQLDDSSRILVDSVTAGRLSADVEGVALYAPSKGPGYVLVSSQGDNSYAVYDRLAPHAYRGSFAVGDHTPLNGAQETDGIEALAVDLGSDFPEGIFVAQDGFNQPLNQNFKLVDWRSIRATLHLPSPE